MNPAHLLAHFERLADAPDAIQRLRRFILDLAVRGKLVEQDPNDEPALELLKRIAAEKARSIKAGEIKKPRDFPSVEDPLFDLPPHWAWTRLGSITSYIQRGKSPEYAASDGTPVISQKCVQWSGLDLHAAKRIKRESLAKYEPVRFLRNGDLLWNSTGTGTIGRVIRLVDPPDQLVCDSHVTVVRCTEVAPDFVRTWLRTDHVYGVIEERAAGSTNQVELTAQMAVGQPVPLPPLAEQHRIVARVDELMALCDRLEAARNERESRRDRLAAASLHRLSQPAGEDRGGTFRADVRFYLGHLPRLTTRPDHVRQLRQTILNLAVRGRLVPQAPAGVTEASISPALRPSGKQLAEDEIPFDLPAGWRWVRFAEVATFENGDRSSKYPKRTEYVEHGVPWINTGHIMPDGSLSIETMNYITPAKFDELGGGKIRQGDILYCLRGATFGKTAFVEPLVRGAIASSLMIIRPEHEVDRRYTYHYLISPFGRSQLQRFDNGTAQPNLASASVKQYLVPLPPLAEQHRIVAKVNELMALCDRLEARLAETAADSRRLLESVLHEALEPAEGALEAAD